jgi:hypothetical protein
VEAVADVHSHDPSRDRGVEKVIVRNPQAGGTFRREAKT